MRILKKLLIGLVILWGLLALMVRSATPFITDYREQLAGLLSQQLGVPVAIGGLKARWYGLRPLLEFDRVRFGEPRGEVLEVDRVTFDLAPEHLLRGSWFDAMRVTVDGMQLTVVREPTGQLHLEGIGTFKLAGERSQRPLVLPSHVRLLNTRVSWIDRKAGKAPLPIENVAVLIDREDSRLSLRASLETGRGKADLSARLDGLPTTTEWGGDTYLRVANLDVADLFAQYMPASYGLQSLRLDLESWGRWENAAPVHSQGSFQLRDLDLRPRVEASAPLQVWQAGARFSLRRDAQGLRFGLKDLQLTFHDHRWPVGDLAIGMLQHDGARRLEAAADYLQIDDVVRILQVRLPWPDLKDPIEHLRPRGELHDLRLSGEITDGRLAWRGRARLAGLTTAPWGALPGVTNLSGTAHGQHDHLLLNLDSRDTILDFNGLFREPIALAELRGRLDLVGDASGWQASSEQLLAVNPHIRTLSRVRVEQGPDRPLYLDLQTDFHDGDAAFAGRYYPVAIMGENLVDWLDQAIVSGRVIQGTALLQGPLDSFAFEERRNGVFQVVFDTEDVLLDYREGWPKVEGLAARVKFHGNQLDIDASSGRIYDSRIVGASAHIESLNPASEIHIQGRLDGPLRDKLRALGEAALRPQFGQFAEIMRGEGDTRLHLDFRVPLAAHRDYALEGRLELDGNLLALPDWDFTLQQVSGSLNFTLDGLNAKGVRAQVLDTPVTIDVVPRDDGATAVQARGRFAPAAIARRFPALPTALLAGEADFSIDLVIPRAVETRGRQAQLTLQSDLSGIGVALPPPFGKETGERRSFTLRVPLGDRAEPASLDYAGLVSCSFSTDGERVDVSLGGTQAQPRPAPGIRIGGHLTELDVPAWSPVLALLPTTGTEAQSNLSADLNIDRLRIYNTQLKQLHVAANRNNGIWQGNIDAPNLAGTFTVPERSGTNPIEVDLQRLRVTAPLGSMEAAIEPLPDTSKGPDPAALQGLRLSIADLRVNDARLGQLRVAAQRADEGLRLTELSLRGGALELESAGHWSRDGEAFLTHIGGRVSTDNLGDLLVDLGYSRQVEGTGGSAEFLLQWPGSPIQFHRASLHGRVGLDVGAGRLVELDPGVTRVVGLLNLNALTRRLRLDFSDIYKKGYSFDSIQGDFRFERGSARTDDLSVLGPTGRIDLSGSADLMARTLDQKVVVTPNLDATLPIAGAIAGGPVAGIAVLVAQKVMNKQVENINRFEYSLSGPWDQPEVKQLDTGGTLSKILQPFSREDGAAPTEGSAESTQMPGEPTAPTAPTSPAAEAAAQEPATAQKPPEEKGPLQRLLELLPKGEPHGDNLPGLSD